MQIQLVFAIFLIKFKFLLNNTTSFLFLIDAIAIANKDTAVIVFIPPAVPTGEPPINIRIKHIITD